MEWGLRLGDWGLGFWGFWVGGAAPPPHTQPPKKKKKKKKK
jgi:hypothetical protein